MATLLFTIEAATQADGIAKAQSIAGAFFGGLTGVTLSVDNASIVPKVLDAGGVPTLWTIQVQAQK